MQGLFLSSSRIPEAVASASHSTSPNAPPDLSIPPSLSSTTCSSTSMSGSVGSGSDVTPPVAPDVAMSSTDSTGTGAGAGAGTGMLAAPTTPNIDSAPADSNPVSPRNPFEQPVPLSRTPTKAEQVASSRSGASAGLEHAEHSNANNAGAMTPPRPMTEPRNNTQQHPRTSPDQSSRNSLPPSSPSHSLQSNSIGSNSNSNSNNLTPQPSPAQAPRPVEVPNTAALQIPRFGPLPTSEPRQRHPYPNTVTTTTVTAAAATTPPPNNRARQQMQTPERDDPHLHPHQHPHMRPPIFDDDDETTEPSSAGNTAEREEFQEGNSAQTNGGVGAGGGASVTGSVVKFFENTRKRLSTSRHPEDDEGSDDDDGPIIGEGEGALPGSLICGSLQKLGRNGKWQMRWFETDGECLSYYKSNKRNKLLATLDLAKVGAILIDEEDEKGQSFTIQVLGRLYLLRADSKASCKDWVITLNRIKEARLHQGNVKLVNPTFRTPVDLLDQSSDTRPRVVVVANRERTRAVAETVDWDMIHDPAEPQKNTLTPHKSEKRLSTIGTVVLARWTKRRSSMSRLSAKLAKWARSLKKYSCTDVEKEGLYLDRHVHPPGHDDRAKHSVSGPASTGMSESSIASSDDGLSGWIGKETLRSSRSSPEDSEGTELKPKVHRALSVVSEDGTRMLS